MKECTNDQNKQQNKTRKYKENKNSNNTTVVPEGVIPKYLQTIYKQYTDIYLYINMNQHCWLQSINIFSYLSDKSLIERQVAIKFARFYRFLCLRYLITMYTYFYHIYIIVFTLDKLLLKQNKLPELGDILTTISLEQLTTERQGYQVYLLNS